LVYYGRKCQPELWQPVDGWELDEVPATTMFIELRTKDNTLSFWDATEDKVGAADVALAFASTLPSFPETLFIVLVSKDGLEQGGVIFQQTDGLTKVTHMIKRHYDAMRLTPERLATISRHIAAAVRSEDVLVMYSIQDIKDMLAAAVRSRKIQLHELKGDVQKAVAAQLRQ